MPRPGSSSTVGLRYFQPAFAKNLPFFFTRTVNIPGDTQVPAGDTGTILNDEVPGTVGASIMDWDYRVEFNHTYTPRHAQLSLYHRRASTMTSTLIYHGGSRPLNELRQRAAGAVRAGADPELGPINAIRWDGWEHYQSATLVSSARSRVV